MSWVKPWRDARGWAFGDGAFADPVEGMSFLREAYEATTAGYGHHVSVPVLWDRHEHRIVNNESEDIVRFFPTWSDDAPDLYPPDLRAEIDPINDRIYHTVNNGTYKAGFARSQRAYEPAYTRLFESLEWLDELLASRRYVAGDRSPRPTGACSRRSCASTPSTTRTFAATAARSTTSRTCGLRA